MSQSINESINPSINQSIKSIKSIESIKSIKSIKSNPSNQSINPINSINQINQSINRFGTHCLLPNSLARRNARERLNPPPHAPQAWARSVPDNTPCSLKSAFYCLQSTVCRIMFSSPSLNPPPGGLRIPPGRPRR